MLHSCRRHHLDQVFLPKIFLLKRRSQLSKWTATWATAKTTATPCLTIWWTWKTWASRRKSKSLSSAMVKPMLLKSRRASRTGAVKTIRVEILANTCPQKKKRWQCRQLKIRMLSISTTSLIRKTKTCSIRRNWKRTSGSLKKRRRSSSNLTSRAPELA